ncbi:MAG: LamG domain-containing protein [bacterium]|nr:LamG domain-containing protein [bacterium]
MENPNNNKLIQVFLCIVIFLMFLCSSCISRSLIWDIRGKNLNDKFSVLIPAGSGTTFLDKSRGGSTHTITRVGSTTWSSGQQLFGKDTIYFDGVGDWLNTDSSSDFMFGINDFTIDLFVYVSDYAAERMIFSSKFSEYSYFILQINIGGLIGTIDWSMNKVSGSNPVVVRSSSQLPLNQFVHIACVRYGNTFEMFFNGESQGTADATGANFTFTSLAFGQWWDRGIVYLTGYLSNIRVTKGFARWTRNFTPPNRSF